MTLGPRSRPPGTFPIAAARVVVSTVRVLLSSLPFALPSQVRAPPSVSTVALPARAVAARPVPPVGRLGRELVHHVVPGIPECPLTQRKVTGTSGESATARSGSHRSRFATGLRCEFFQSRLSQPSHHRSRKQLTTYVESLTTWIPAGRSGVRARRASSTAVISIRWFVVLRLGAAREAAPGHRPGPAASSPGCPCRRRPCTRSASPLRLT